MKLDIDFEPTPLVKNRIPDGEYNVIVEDVYISTSSLGKYLTLAIKTESGHVNLVFWLESEKQEIVDFYKRLLLQTLTLLNYSEKEIDTDRIKGLKGLLPLFYWEKQMIVGFPKV